MSFVPAQIDLLDSLSADLSRELRNRTDQLLLEIVRPNSTSQFGHHAPELAPFREAIAKDPEDNLHFLRSFRESVPLIDYEAYKPFVAKFFATPCREVDVKDMLAPGLPYFFSLSSATSGKVPKIFPKYLPLQQHVWKPLQPFSLSVGTALVAYSLYYREIISIEECENNRVPTKLLVGAVTSCLLRTQMDWDPEEDHKRFNLRVPGQTGPYVIALVNDYRSSLLLHALFSVADPGMTTIACIFATSLANILDYMEDEWPVIVDCVEKGTILPDLQITEDVRAALEKQIVPNPLRAAELRAIGPPSSRPSWAIYVWPALKTFVSITGGASAVVVPRITYVLGPSVVMRCPIYGSSEYEMIALPYDKGNPANDLKITMAGGLIEFMEITFDDTPQSILSSWELVPGRQYEPILTTRDGLWRYRIRDIVLVKGFAPEDGLPVINYVGRRDGLLKVAHLMVSESELTSTILSAAKLSIGQIAGFVAIIDEREAPVSFGYLVEASGEIGKDAHFAPQYALEHLMTLNDQYRVDIGQGGEARKPTIRLLEKGTFAEFRKLKCEKGGASISQVKVPIVLSDQASRNGSWRES